MSNWPTGDGEMARLIRAHDWAATPLGAIVGWPQSLRTIVDLVLSSTSMMSLVWGDEAIHLYNDGFAVLLHEHRTLSLGRSAYETFARSRGVFAHDIANGMAGGSARSVEQRYPVVRDGRLEEAWFDVDYAPVRDETGAVGGVLWTLKEVTGRRRAEGSLRESEARHRLLVQSWTQAVWETDADGVVVTDSPSWRVYTGQTLKEWLGYGWLDAIHPDDRAYAERQWRDAVARQGLVDAEFRLRAPDGGWRWTNVRAAPVLDAAGRIEKWAGMNIDIDDRRSTEAALRASEDLRRIALEGGSMGAWRWDLRERLIWGDARFLSLWGYPPSDGPHPLKLFMDRMSTEGAAETAGLVTRAIEAGEEFDGELEIVSGPTAGSWVRWRGRADGPENRIVHGISFDTTQQRHVAAALRKSEARFRAFVTASSDVVYRMSPDWSEMHHLDGQGFLVDTGEVNPSWIDLYIDPADRDVVVATIADAIRAKGMFELEHRIRRADGSLGWTASRAVPMLDEQGTIVEWIGAAKDVTARRHADDALRDSQERLALAFRTIPVGIAILDVAGTVVLANDEMRRFLPTGKIPSHDLDRVSRWRGWDIDGQRVGPDDFPGARALRGETVSPGMQMLYGDDSDNEIWTEVLSTPMRDREGHVTGAISVVVDVDRVKRSEERAQASEERLRQFGEASQDILWIRDADTLQWTYLTPAFEAIFGLSCEAALTGDNYRGWQDLIVPEDRAGVTASMARVGAGAHVTFEYRIRRFSDGEVRWLRNTDFPMRDETGRVAWIGGVGHDITALKAIETALTHSEGRLRHLVEGVSQLVWRAVDRGDWVWASPQWTAFTGQAEAESHGRGWLAPVKPDDRPIALAAWALAEETRGFEVEYRIRNAATGAYRWFQTRVAPRLDPRGEIVEWLGTSTDVHQLKALQESQAVMVAELQHRTRNLIAVVRGIADDTMEQTGPTEAFRSALDDRLTALSRVQGLLSRAEVEPITIAAVVRLELDALGAGACGERITVAGPAVWLKNSTVQTLALALHELATNARKYGALSHERGNLAVTWSERREDGERRLVLEWLETGLEHASNAVQPAFEGGGYGRELIEQALPHALGARTSFTLGETGVRCTIDLPARQDGWGGRTA